MFSATGADKLKIIMFRSGCAYRGGRSRRSAGSRKIF